MFLTCFIIMMVDRLTLPSCFVIRNLIVLQRKFVFTLIWSLLRNRSNPGVFSIESDLLVYIDSQEK